jgi:hypothetical protein
LRSAHQNNLKTSKIYYFKVKKKIQIFSKIFLESTFKQARQGKAIRKSDARKKGGEKSRLGTVCYCICKVFL